MTTKCLHNTPVYSSTLKKTQMATNLAIDDELINEARRIGRHRTKREAVTAALKEYIQRRQQVALLDLFGQVPYEPEYDYKAERWRTRS